MSNLQTGVSRRDWLNRLRGFEARWWAAPLLIFLVTRVVVFYAAFVPAVVDHADFIAPDSTFYNVGPWGRWDTNLYVQIAQKGYSSNTDLIAFFPLYPMLIQAVAPVFDGDGFTAGIVVSNICLLAALLVFYQVCRLDLSEGDSRRAVWYLAAFPAAFFFSIPYTESLFLLLSVTAFYCARRRWWFRATVMAALASGTRIPGVFVGMVVVLEWLAAHGWTFKTLFRGESWRGLWNGVRHDFLTLGLLVFCISGLVAYMLYVHVNYGGISYFLEVQKNWGHVPSGMTNPFGVLINDVLHLVKDPPTPQVAHLRTNLPYYRAVEVAMFLLTVMMSVTIWRRFSERYALYCLASVMLPAMSRMTSMVRYVVVLFPLAMLLALWGRNSKIHRALVWSFMVLLGICMALFAEGFWIG